MPSISPNKNEAPTVAHVDVDDLGKKQDIYV